MPDKFILFDCGPVGNIVAAPGIHFRPVALPVEIGSLVVAEATGGNIEVNIDLDNHVTFLALKKTDHPDPKRAKVAIRAPIGVRIFQLTRAREGAAEELYHETGPGYNTLPKHIPPDKDKDHGQTVQEVVLITGHVPPRRDPSQLQAGDFAKFTELTPEEVAARLKQNG